MVTKKITITNLKIHFVLFPLLLILSACGGGGGGAGSSPRSVAACTDSGTAFQTTEYLAMGGGTTGRALSMICASNAYARGYTGSGIKIGVMDSGIRTTHQEFSDVGKLNIATGSDYVNSDNDPTDDNGHGSHVAGIIAADKDGTGMHGVAYDAKIYAFKVLNAAGSGSYANLGYKDVLTTKVMVLAINV